MRPAPVSTQLSRRDSPAPQCPQCQRIVPFRQPLAVFVTHQLAVEKFRRRKTKRAIQQNLPRGADEQIRAAHDFGNVHRRIVHRARKLIRRHAVAAPDDKIAKVFSGDELLRAKIFIVKGNGFAIRHAEAPRKF